MVTNYVLYDPSGRVFVAAGSWLHYTCSLNYAKHFSSEWSAKAFRDKYSDLDVFVIKKIVRY